MFIDWLTIRIPLLLLDKRFYYKIEPYLNTHLVYDSKGKEVRSWISVDFEKLRSDSPGFYWSFVNDGNREYLSIGGSPASCLNDYKNNVFGILDVKECAHSMISCASDVFDYSLPHDLSLWQCRRIDITANYLLPDAESVQLALAQLLQSNAARKRASSSSLGGDSVYWGGSSTMSKGKAYWKGQHLRYLRRKFQVSLPLESDFLLMDRVLRLEHTRGSAFFRRMEHKHLDYRWYEHLSFENCKKLFLDFFSPLVPGFVEVSDMNRIDIVSRLMKENDISETVAKSVFNTLRNIRADGFDVVKGYMPKNTFYRHLRFLRAIGITDSDMYMAKVIPLRKVKIVLAQPVTSWEELRKVA